MSTERPQRPSQPQRPQSALTPADFDAPNVVYVPTAAETPEERQARLQQATADAATRRRILEDNAHAKRRIAYLITVFLIVAAFASGWVALFADDPEATTRSVAGAVVTTIVGGLVGGLAGYVLAAK